MILNSDFILYDPLWEKAQDDLMGRLGLFSRLVDIFLIACAIGIKDDKQIKNEDIEYPLAQPKNIGRNTYISQTNSDLSESLNMLLENAIMTSNLIDFDIDERLKLAFNPDYENKKFSPAAFLVAFANYGINEMFKHINCDLPATTVADDLYNYLNDQRESNYQELIETISLDELL